MRSNFERKVRFRATRAILLRIYIVLLYSLVIIGGRGGLWILNPASVKAKATNQTLRKLTDLTMSLPSIPSVPLASAVNYTVTDTTCSVGDLSDPVLQLVLPSIGGLIPGGFDPATFPTACNIECIGRASFVPTDSTNLILSLGAGMSRLLF
jgi:hypothetical protein